MSISGRKGMKAQTEIIIVLAVVIVGAVAVLFATKTINLLPPEPESISLLKNSLRTDIHNRITADAISIIKKVAAGGGHLDLQANPQIPSLDYSGSKVAFWQFANLSIPRTNQDFEAAIAKGIKESLKDLDPNKFESVKGKDVKIESPRSVEAKIGGTEVSVKVDMPVSVEGYGFEGPIEVKIPSKLGKAIDFANELVGKSQKKELEYRDNDETGQPTTKVLGVLENRYFERFTLDAMRKYSDVDQFGNPLIPTEGVLTGCSTPPINKEWSEIKPEMQNLINGMLENTYTAGKVPAGITDSSRYPAYVLPVFTDLDAKFFLGEDLNEKSFQLFQNNPVSPGRVVVKTENFPYTSTCISPPYRVLYFLIFPVVAEVGDEDLKLKFAFHTYVNGYEPGDYKDLGVVLDFFEDELRRCNTASCPAKITLRDGSGPVAFSQVSFSYCNIGRTDREGVLEANIPCGISILEISDKDHKTYRTLAGSDSLKDKTITLSRTTQINLRIFNLELVNQSGVYTISDVKPNAENFTLAILQGDKPTYLTTSKDTEATNQIPTGEDIILSTDVRKEGTVLGGFVAKGKIDESTIDMWLYNPIFKDGYSQEDAAAALSTRDLLTTISVACGEKLKASLPVTFDAVDETRLKGLVCNS